MWGFFYILIYMIIDIFKIRSNLLNEIPLEKIFVKINNEESPTILNLKTKSEWNLYKKYFYSDSFILYLKKNNKKITFTDFMEGNDIRITQPHWYDFIIWLNSNGIDVVFKSNNLSIVYDKIKHIPNIYFIKSNNYNKQHIKKRNITKKFIFLNGTEQNARTVLYNKFKDFNILKNMHYSINARHPDLNPHKLLSDTFIKDEEYLEIKKEYFQSFCNIIVESKQKYVFFSEKIFKSLSIGQPFIVMGAPHYLKYLRVIGFKTFHDFWDESYDNEKIIPNRIDKIFDLVFKINNMSMEEIETMNIKMQDILNHNIYHFKYLKRLNITKLEKFINTKINNYNSNYMF